MSPLAHLARVLRDEGGLIGAAVAESEAPTPYGDAAGEHALTVEAIHEGYLLHYEDGRVVRTEDPDLALLAGDRLYAFGLARLAAIGDLEAVRILADVISACARAQAEDRPDDAHAAWRDGARAVAREAGA